MSKSSSSRPTSAKDKKGSSPSSSSSESKPKDVAGKDTSSSSDFREKGSSKGKDVKSKSKDTSSSSKEVEGKSKDTTTSSKDTSSSSKTKEGESKPKEESKPKDTSKSKDKPKSEETSKSKDKPKSEETSKSKDKPKSEEIKRESKEKPKSTKTEIKREEKKYSIWNSPDPIVISILARNAEPFLDRFLNCILNQTCSKDKIHLYIRSNNSSDDTDDIIDKFISEHKTKYASVKWNDEDLEGDFGDDFDETTRLRDWNGTRYKIMSGLRQESIKYAISKKAHYFSVDCDNFIVPDTLEQLYKLNQQVSAPMMKSSHKTSLSNFFLKTLSDGPHSGFFEETPHYYPIYSGLIRGMIEVDLIHSVFFVRNEALDKIKYDPESTRPEHVSMCSKLRESGVKMYISNMQDFGYLTTTSTKEELEQEPWIRESWILS